MKDTHSMATTEYRSASPELTAGELSISIYPRVHDSWRGTASQLTEAGLIPPSFQWPSRTKQKSFSHNGIECRIRRRPLPGGTRGRSWVDVDHWEVIRYCEGRMDSCLHEKLQAVEHELWLRSPEAKRLFARFWAAHNDSEFQAFKRRSLGLPNDN